MGVTIFVLPFNDWIHLERDGSQMTIIVNFEIKFLKFKIFRGVFLEVIVFIKMQTQKFVAQDGTILWKIEKNFGQVSA